MCGWYGQGLQRTRSSNETHILAGNYRMTELQAAVALAQLEKLDSIVKRRRQWCSELSDRLQGTPGLRCPKPTPGCDPSWWFYMMRVDEAEMGCTTDELANALRAEGLPVGAHYIVQCVYEYPVFVGHSPFARGSHAFERVDYGKGMCPEAESLSGYCSHPCRQPGVLPAGPGRDRAGQPPRRGVVRGQKSGLARGHSPKQSGAASSGQTLCQALAKTPACHAHGDCISTAQTNQSCVLCFAPPRYS